MQGNKQVFQGIVSINTLRPRQNGCQFPDNIFKCILLNENKWIAIEISLKFVPKGPINNIPALVQIMAWHRPGDKPLSAPMMVSLLTHICVTLPQWVKSLCYFRFLHLTQKTWPQALRHLHAVSTEMARKCLVNSHVLDWTRWIWETYESAWACCAAGRTVHLAVLILNCLGDVWGGCLTCWGQARVHTATSELITKISLWCQETRVIKVIEFVLTHWLGIP